MEVRARQQVSPYVRSSHGGQNTVSRLAAPTTAKRKIPSKTFSKHKIGRRSSSPPRQPSLSIGDLSQIDDADGMLASDDDDGNNNTIEDHEEDEEEQGEAMEGEECEESEAEEDFEADECVDPETLEPEQVSKPSPAVTNSFIGGLPREHWRRRGLNLSMGSSPATIVPPSPQVSPAPPSSRGRRQIPPSFSGEVATVSQSPSPGPAAAAVSKKKPAPNSTQGPPTKDACLDAISDLPMLIDDPVEFVQVKMLLKEFSAAVLASFEVDF